MVIFTRFMYYQDKLLRIASIVLALTTMYHAVRGILLLFHLHLSILRWILIISAFISFLHHSLPNTATNNHITHVIFGAYYPVSHSFSLYTLIFFGIFLFYPRTATFLYPNMGLSLYLLLSGSCTHSHCVSLIFYFLFFFSFFTILHRSMDRLNLCY